MREMIEVGLRSAYFLKRHVSQECSRIIRVLRATLASSHKTDTTSHRRVARGSYGSTSGHMYKYMPGLVRRVYAIPYEVFEIADYQAKYYAIMRISL